MKSCILVLCFSLLCVSSVRSHEVDVVFDAPSVLLTKNIEMVMETYREVTIEEVPYSPTKEQVLILGESAFWPRTITYRKGSTLLHVTFSKRGYIHSVFIEDRTKGREAETIMDLGNIKWGESLYRVKVQKWVNYDIAMKHGRAKVAGIHITKLR